MVIQYRMRAPVFLERTTTDFIYEQPVPMPVSPLDDTGCLGQGGTPCSPMADAAAQIWDEDWEGITHKRWDEIWGLPASSAVNSRDIMDLSQLIAHPSDSALLRAEGKAMAGAGIFPGDLLIVERNLRPKHGSIILAMIGSKRMVRRLFRRKGVVKLVAANPAYPSITMSEDTDTWCWGVVRATIRHMAGFRNLRAYEHC